MPFSAQQLITDLDAVLRSPVGQPRSSAYVARKLNVTNKSVERNAECAEMEQLCGVSTEGWVCTGSGVYMLSKGEIAQVSGRTGPLNWGEVLSAELVQDGRSVHVRRHGASLVLHTFDEGGPDGEGFVSEDVAFLSTAPGRGKLHYRVYWGADGSQSDIQGSCRRLARFIGFSE